MEQDRTTSRQSPFVDEEGRPLIFTSCEITVIAGPDRGRSLTTQKRLVRIGAAEDNDLVLTDDAVSRYHLEVVQAKSAASEGGSEGLPERVPQVRGGEYVVLDVGSTNGTFSGALQVTQATLRGSTELRVGNDTLRFVPHDHAERVAPSLSRRCGEMVGASPPMRAVFGMIERVAPTELPVLVTGETGTGKELVARAIHELGVRKQKPFVTLDCGALPPTLIESALFGYERGAFTGADRQYAGVFERAHGGTLFLDELGELPIELQPKLLRAVERGEIERLRGEGAVRVDVRIIAATNRSLEEMVAEKRFRSDLYYRLAVVHLALPALRERPGDLPLLVEHLLERFGRARVRFEADAMSLLARHSFPGNVRELANLVRRFAVLADGDRISAADVKKHLTPGSAEVSTPLAAGPSEDWNGLSFKDAKSKLVDHFEQEYLEHVLKRHRFNVSSAAREAGIGRRHFHRLLEKYGISTRKES